MHPVAVTKDTPNVPVQPTTKPSGQEEAGSKRESSTGIGQSSNKRLRLVEPSSHPHYVHHPKFEPSKPSEGMREVKFDTSNTNLSLFDVIACARRSGNVAKDATIGEPPFAPPRAVGRFLAESKDEIAHNCYPNLAGHPKLIEAYKNYMSYRFGLECGSENILATSGAKEAIHCWVMSNVPTGGVLAIPQLCYPAPITVAEKHDRSVFNIPSDPETGLIDFKNMDAADIEKISAIYVNYPHNPTGVVATREFFHELVEFSLKHNLPILNDLAYCENEFLDTPADSLPLSIYQCHSEAVKVATEVHSVSKWLSSANLRVGALIGPAEVIDNALEEKACFSDGHPEMIQLAAAKTINTHCKLIGDEQQQQELQDDLNERKGKMTERKNAVIEKLDAAGFEYMTPKAGMFVMIKVPEPFTVEEYCEELFYKHGALLMPGTAFGEETGKGYVRISLSADKPTLSEIVDDMVAVRDSKKAS